MNNKQFGWKIFFIIIACILIRFSSFANGGVVDASLFKKTKNIQLLQKANISLIKENLNLVIQSDHTTVHVEYTLKNNGKQDQLMYGFPVDAFEGGFYGDYYHLNPFHESWEDKHQIIDYFKAQENKNPIKITGWVRDSVYKAKTVLRRGEFQIYRKWHVFKLLFKEGETKTIQVEYKVQNNKRDNVHGFEFVHNYSNRKFTYDLSPASTWGNGIIGEFNLTIDISDISNFENNYTINGIEDLIQKGDNYSFQAFNYDLNQSEKININYNVSKQRLTYFMNRNMLPSHFIKHIRSSNKNSKTEYLLDNNPNTFWTGKIGDWIEIEFNDIPKGNGMHKKLLALMALNGNYSDHLEFMNNGKITKCQLIMNDSLLYNTEPWNSQEGNRIIKVPKSNFQSVSDMKGNVVTLAQGAPLFMKEFSRYEKFKLKKIRLEILAIEEGFEMEGTCCISELYFLGR